ncbi:hypothetical protein GCM10022419_135230 [Nonomuraea rosea]|uniref:ABC transporter permease n=1 Tax=Nonomuraea rosea TaxID=638574 RepID=A0ABP7A7X4_9ACTN
MSTGTITPYRSGLRTGRDRFVHLLRAEWTKFRTVRGWVTAMVLAALVTVLLGLFSASNGRTSCGGASDVCPAVPVGPGGEAVDDRFYFVHQPLAGDGSITVRVSAMTGRIRLPDTSTTFAPIVSAVVPWAKAGIMIKESTRQGSAYAAVMVTGSHGVRMQHDFTHDVARQPGGVSKQSPRWLRLTRSGDTLTGYESANGKQWTKIGTARLASLPATVRVGLFVTSPGDLSVTQGDSGGAAASVRFTEATAAFDQVKLQGKALSGAWSRDDVGVALERDGSPHHPGAVVQSGDTFTVTGVGDIAPRTVGQTIESTLVGVLVGLLVAIVVTVLFITAEYRRGLIRTTLLASPRRGRVLMAKATVIAAVTFIAGLAAAGVTVTFGAQIMRSNSTHVLPVTLFTEMRVVVGIAALLAVFAVLALALGALFRHSATAVTATIVMIVLPYILASVSVLPVGVSQWLLRLTPAAGFAIQQSIPQYEQVIGHYTPQAGYYPLAPWAGFAVSCGYAALALALAAFQLRRRDA